MWRNCNTANGYYERALNVILFKSSKTHHNNADSDYFLKEFLNCNTELNLYLSFHRSGSKGDLPKYQSLCTMSFSMTVKL